MKGEEGMKQEIEGAGSGEPASRENGAPRKVRILWLSRHTPQSKQLEELRRVFGDIEIIRISKTVSSGDEVIALMRENECDELVAVLPLNIIAQVIGRGIKPIRAVMDRKVRGDNVIFQHSHFERVLEVYVKSEPLEVNSDSFPYSSVCLQCPHFNSSFCWPDCPLIGGEKNGGKSKFQGE